MKIERAIISGGGTGGHIFPAIAIADEIKRRNPNAEILFVGAEGKMEMDRVPKAGYNIEGLHISGFKRKISFDNFLLIFKILKSMMKARKIIKKFKPQIAIGVGGYASGPTLKIATMRNIPSAIQEQNSFPGKTNKLLAQKVQSICVAYEGLEKYFPADKITVTGNPVRANMVDIHEKKTEALEHFKLDNTQKVILILGGSLGARTLNESVLEQLDIISTSNVQILWQCGKLYYDNIRSEKGHKLPKNVHLNMFIDRMDLAYAAADVVISRAGAISVSELCLVQKPTILVPSPNVAEDHQTKNAMALVHEDAAFLVKDKDAKETLIREALQLVNNTTTCSQLSENIAKLAKPNATRDIVDQLEKIIQ